MSIVCEKIGDNKEIGLPTIGDYTIYFADSTKTSADDTTTEKYVDNPQVVKNICIRTDQTIQIVSMNGIVFSNPVPILINTSYVEKQDEPLIFKIVIRTTVVNTNVSIRFRGR